MDGPKQFLSNDLSPLLCMGVTFAFLNISGRDPSENDLLNRINKVSSEYAFSRYTIITQCCFSVSRTVYI